ncbi:hypothetical protein POM88_020674 [Heracleum sosnowskyi]|uniref:Uncharacterized protein n=1 Tax=Heracleum sosnowskyi TaxID=360622 RepID=A0AAD8MS70_9APIA|nr:hypothetical protein POM88_020674 [Heracleum sosnowskyi]
MKSKYKELKTNSVKKLVQSWNCREIVNGSTLDHLPHLNQVAANVGNWDPWPQSKQGDSGMYMLSYVEYYATMPYFPQGELDIGAHRSRLAFLFLFLWNGKAIYTAMRVIG